MNYSGHDLHSQFVNGHLCLHIKKITDECFQFLDIILDAAVSHDMFSMTVDLRHCEKPSIMSTFMILKFMTDFKVKVEGKLTKMAILVENYVFLWKTFFQCTGIDFIVTNDIKKTNDFFS